MKLERQIEDLQAQRASEWFEILKQGRPEDLAAFRDWCKRSPLHIQEFLEITWTDRSLEDIQLGSTDSADALLNELRSNVEQWPLEPDRHGRVSMDPGTRLPRWRWVAAAAAALIACVFGLALYLHPWFVSDEYATNVGEQRTLVLSDRSVITLNTDSQVAVRLGLNARNVELQHGEAIFKVAHDKARPFRVRTRAGTVQAVGTQFNVYDKSTGTQVAVIEGRVRLTAAGHAGDGTKAVELSAGGEASIGLDGSITRSADPDVARAIAWSKRRLRFDNATLDDILAEFERYHRDLPLRVENVPPDSHHYSGIFDADDPSALVKLLEREQDLQIDRVNGEIVIRPKVPGSGSAATH